MDKDSGHYCYETYPSVTKNNTNSLKNNGKYQYQHAHNSNKSPKDNGECCDCFGTSKAKSKKKALLTGLATNLGICVLLFGYTLVGSVVFLAIEGGENVQHQILATTSMATNANYKKPTNSTGSAAEFKTKADEVRAKTVENIWDITVSLNILYRDNWTKLAAQEITRFQDELLKTLTDDNYQEYPVVDRKSSGRMTQEGYEWTFARSFLYSLTVLTTIGEYFLGFLRGVRKSLKFQANVSSRMSGTLTFNT